MSKAKFTSPVGNIMWAFVTGQGRENLNGQMQYSLEVHANRADVQEFIDEIDSFWEDNKPKSVKKAKSLGYKDVDEDTVAFTAKTNTTYQSGDPKKIALYDAKGRRLELDEGVRIGNNSKGRFSATMAIYDAGKMGSGVTFYLNSVQIAHLVQYEDSDSFDEIDGDCESDFEEISV